MQVFIKLTTAGNNTGPFNLFSDADGFTTAFETGVSKAQLLAGYSIGVVPAGTTIIKVASDSLCDNSFDIILQQPTTTTTSTTNTTSTTTTIPPV
jgi:hypothetical protein|tara:strand:+ start:1372 stop:1656 length:285 start_codon:yes stop_codon:yes gene_type:complete